MGSGAGKLSEQKGSSLLNAEADVAEVARKEGTEAASEAAKHKHHHMTSKSRVEVFVNGKALHVPNIANLVEACRMAGVYVPTLCYHPRLQPIGKCGLCCIKVDSNPDPVLGCSSRVTPGMKITTDTAESKTRASIAMNRIVSKISSRALKDFTDAPELDNIMHHLRMFDNTNSLTVDMSKCTECTRCVRMCRDVQALAIWKFNDGAAVAVSTAGHTQLVDTMCVSCGQCVNVCPSGALLEQSKISIVTEALKSGKVVVATMAPSVRVAIGEEFGLPPGSISTGKAVMALKRCGITFVFDVNFGADMTIMEESKELAGRLKAGGPFPMFTSCCPAWINLVEKKYPELIPHLSTSNSPIAMIGPMIKTYFAKKLHKRPEDIFHLCITPCTAKKDEAARPQHRIGDVPTIDYVMTTRECAKWLKKCGIDSSNFDLEMPFDSPLGIASGAGAIFGVSGGVTEAVLRTAFAGSDIEEVQTGGPQLFSSEVQALAGFQGVKTACFSISGQMLRIAVVHGISNVKKFLADIQQVGLAKCGYHFVEIMSCPGGCIGGGGQPASNHPDILKKRTAAIREVDKQCQYKRSCENPAIIELYTKFLGEPNGPKAEQLLHTHYSPRPVAETEAEQLPAPTELEAVAGIDTIGVLYATVGGTTELAAQRIFKELKASKLNAQIWPMDGFLAANLKKLPYAIFLTCTFGDGELPPMSHRVMEWLEEQPNNTLKNLKFAVFGLGSTKYSNFCMAAKKFDFKLAGLGGTRLIEVGLGDARAEDGYNTSFDPWLLHLYEDLGVEPPKSALVPHYRVTLGFQASFPIPPPDKSMYAKVTRSVVLTKADYERPVRYIEFDMSDTGDVLGIHPENLPAHVSSFLEWYGLSATAVVTISPIGDAATLPIPPSVTVQHLFTRYLDIFCKPRKLFLRQLAQFAINPAEKVKLEGLSNKNGSRALSEYLKDNPSHVDVLRDFPSAHPTLDFLVEMLPLIKPRLYSIASCQEYVGPKAQLMISIPSDISRARGQIHGGLSTTWVSSLKPGDLVPVKVGEGCIRPPNDASAPILMCALGTGMASMRAILQHRIKQKQDGILSMGVAVLYQACEYEEGELVFQDEIGQAITQGVLSKHIPIDDVIKEQPEEIWSIMQLPNVHYFFSGPSSFNISAQIESAILSVCYTEGNMTKEQGKALIEKMKTEKRWLVEAY